jgi:signal transduction histidine kinase
MINNAFYAVKEKKQQLADTSLPVGRVYDPMVTVSTKKSGDDIEIRIKDNGIGIQQKVLDKIFQPFFTTKPTGQGTGLGLSLAYDIITNGHGGTLAFVTEEGKGTEFIIQIPYKG